MISNDGRFNLIGFWNKIDDNKTYRYCSIHPYKRLIPSKTDPDNILFCPECGSEFPLKDTVKEQNIQTDVSPNSEPRIIQGKKVKQYYDNFGSLINDETLIQDIKQGKTVIRYEETKSGSDKPVVVKRS